VEYSIWRREGEKVGAERRGWLRKVKIVITQTDGETSANSLTPWSGADW